MAYPYYYPYYSARQVYTPSLEFSNNLAAVRTQQLIREQAEMQYAVRQQEELINNQRLREYDRNKQRINDIIVTNRMEAELEASKLRQTVIQEELNHQDYLRKLDHLRAERNLLERSQVHNSSKTEALRGSGKDEENERRIQQYQQELLSKITGSRDKDTLKQSASANDHSYPHNKPAVSMQANAGQGGEQVIINKRTIQSQKPSESEGKIKFSNPMIEGNLNEKRAQTIDAKRDTVSKYHTLEEKEVNNRDHRNNNSLIDQEDYLKNKYMTERKIDSNRGTKRSRKANRSQLQEKKIQRNRSSIDQTIKKSHLDHTFSQNPNASAIQKIQNRLKLSTIVFKDSKLKNTRHEFQHLFNTFETQVRLRKEVRDRINNHPRILKKHRLVVESR